MKHPVNPLDPNTFVICEICKNKFTRIKNNHLIKHNITLEEYKKNISAKIVSDVLKNNFSITLENLIKRHGQEIGLQKWKTYCSKQAYTNTYEYKKNKYGWTKDQFTYYNKSRAVTLENLIKRHGQEIGSKKWEDYCNIQKYVGVKLEYFIEKYGEKNGTLKYREILDKKCHLKWFGYSKISNDFFVELDTLIKNQETFFNSKNNEFRIKLASTLYKPISLDYYSLTKNKAIEFFGDYWHANPLIYKNPNELLKSGKTVKQTHQDDILRIDLLKKEHNIDVLVIWEKDVRSNIDKEIQKCVRFLNE